MPGPSIGIHISNHESVGRALDLAHMAERTGADAVWLSEDLYFRGALPLASAIATRTSSVSIGFSALTPYGVHAGRMAMDLATLIELAPGRVVLGIGAGVRPNLEKMTARWLNPIDTVREYADALSRLLDGENLTSARPAAPCVDLELAVSPKPGRVPVYAAAVGPKALAQAGGLFDGVLLTQMAAKPLLEWSRGRVVAGAAAADRDPPTTVATLSVRLGHDADTALAAAQTTVAYWMRRWAAIPTLRRMFTTDGTLSEEKFDIVVDRLTRGVEATDAVPTETALAHCPAGTPAEVARQLRNLTAIGIDAFNLELGDADATSELNDLLTDLLRQVRHPDHGEA